MRTILTLDKKLPKELGATRKPFRLATVSLGGVHAGINLDKALSLADAIEDEEIAALRVASPAGTK